MTVRIFHPSLDLGIFFLPGRVRETAQVVQVDRSSLCRTEMAPMSMSTDDDGHFFNDPTFSVKQSSPASTKSFDVCLFGWFRKSVNIVVCFQGFLSLIAEYSDSSSFSPSSFFGRCCCRRRRPLLCRRRRRRRRRRRLFSDDSYLHWITANCLSSPPRNETKRKEESEANFVV